MKDNLPVEAKAIEAAQTTAQADAPLPLGEQTPSQQPASTSLSGIISSLPGFGKAASGSFSTYRLMRTNPTIAIARQAATAPIRAAGVTFAAGRSDTQPEQVRLIEQMLGPMWPGIVRDMLYALDYGFKPFEKVYELRDTQGQTHLWLRKLKPLRVDQTHIVIDRRHGGFLGLRQGSVRLGPEKSFVFTYDSEDDDYYGRSRHENVRESAWKPWTQVLAKMGQYITKAAGVIPMVRFTPGKVNDEHGAQQDAHVVARRLVENLGRGHGVIHPLVMAPWAEDLMQRGTQNISDLLAWQIQFVEVDAGHGREFIDMLRHFERLMLRGWLVPERVVSEGEHGTKAEADTHTSVALLMARELQSQIIRQVNRHLIDPVLVLNYGPKWRGAVVAKAQALDEDTDRFVRQLVRDVLTKPVDAQLIQRFVQFDRLVEMAGLPKADGRESN